MEDSSLYWKKSRVELRAAGFDPDRSAQASAVVTIASAWTNAHRCNNRVRTISDLLIEILAERGGQGLVVGAPAVSDALNSQPFRHTPGTSLRVLARRPVAFYLFTLPAWEILSSWLLTLAVLGLAIGVEFGADSDYASKLAARCREAGLLVSAERTTC